MTASEVRSRLQPILERYPREYHRELGRLIFDLRDEAQKSRPQQTDEPAELLAKISRQDREAQVEQEGHERTEAGLRRRIEELQRKSADLHQKVGQLERRCDDADVQAHISEFIGQLDVIACIYGNHLIQLHAARELAEDALAGSYELEAKRRKYEGMSTRALRNLKDTDSDPAMQVIVDHLLQVGKNPKKLGKRRGRWRIQLGYARPSEID